MPIIKYDIILGPFCFNIQINEYWSNKLNIYNIYIIINNIIIVIIIIIIYIIIIQIVW